MSKAKLTYITYNKGLEAKHLHLGNLVHDYKHPNSYEPYVEKAYTDTAEPAPEWALATPLQNCALTLGKGSLNDGDEEDDENESEGQRWRVVAAAKSIKLDIKDPKKFFTEITLQSPAAKKWLSSHLSAAETLLPHPKPEIWMLTGLILMTHATWTSLSSKETFISGLPAPFDPTGVSAIRRSSVSDHVRPVVGLEVNDEEKKHIPGAVIHETGKYPGTRGWAAQWERVDVKILGADEWKGGVDNQFMLNSAGKDQKIAVVELQAKEYARNENEDEEDDDDDDDDEYWEAFLDAAEEYQ